MGLKRLFFQNGRDVLLGAMVFFFLLGALDVSAQVLENDPTLTVPAKKYPNPPKMPPANDRMVLKGSITTLDAALVQEKDRVDWYGWYMACRQYLLQTGGLDCQIGTMLQFNRNGFISAKTHDSACRVSVAQKFFPLPRSTELDAVLLPVRSARIPPASPEELYQHLQGGGGN